MYYVYILQSQSDPEKVYVGYTTNLQKRLTAHNTGGSVYTANYRPWDLLTCIQFQSKQKAMEFEKYLKTQSGRAFLTKRLI